MRHKGMTSHKIMGMTAMNQTGFSYEIGSYNNAYGEKHFGVSSHNTMNTAGLTNETPLDENDIDSLIHMYQEEKLALDVYTVFSEKYDSAIFEKIASAEAKHLSMVEKIATDNGVDISQLQSLEAGEFLDQDIQDLYNSLIAEGETSYTDALGVGVTIEKDDIGDIENYTQSEDANALIVGVYTNLENGSEHHLNAFTQALA